MSGALATLGAELEERGWALERALPRGLDHAIVQLVDERGTSVAGQWFADPERARRVARATRRTGRPGAVGQPLPHVLAQYDGADRRLLGLADRCASDHAVLRAHRPERRAVVEVLDDEPRFVKMVRPERLDAATVRAMTARLQGVRTPRVLAVDRVAGTITTAAMPGRTLHEAIRAGEAGLAAALREVGSALSRLHRAPVPDEVRVHGPAEEIAVVDRWLDMVRAHGLTAAWPEVDRARARLPGLLPRVGRGGLLHRDLHDKQLTLGADEVGMLDLDLLAVGDPALDLANLVVHLELRARQALLPVVSVRELVAALLAGYRPDARTRAAAAGYLLSARLRLVAVYAFRPASRVAAAALMSEPVIEDLTD